jgi:hypothetical protein
MSAQIAMLTEMVKDQTRKADERGSRTYSELEAIRLDNAEIKRDINSVKDTLAAETEALKTRLDKAEPTLKEIGAWRERFIGMMLLIGFVGSLLGGALVIFWKWVSAKAGL